jgi:folate-binding protein YgfZ
MTVSTQENSSPADYGDVHAEYDALRQSVGVIDLSAVGKLELSGKNAVQFLNGLVSNDVKTLAPGDGVLAAFPTLQGKLAALCRIYNVGAHLLLELAPINREKIFKNLSRFVPAGEFFINDVSDQLALFALQGPRAGEMLATLTEQPSPDATKYKITERNIGAAQVLVATHERCGESGFDLFVPAAAAASVWEQMLAQGARAVGQTAFETRRIEAGVPREGVDAGEDYILLESALDDAVSYTKGCYLGQEVIARIHWRGQPAKQLRGLVIDAEQLPPSRAELHAVDGNMAERRVGEITSSAHSLALDQRIALGYVHRYYLNPGTEFIIKQDAIELGHARLTELPFIKSANATNEI